jgi:hypothetical protein
MRDPRTVARDIPGVLEAIFPHLNAGLVTLLNKEAVSFPGLRAIPERDLESSTLPRAMLFELAVARAEQLLRGVLTADWGRCLSIAVARQRQHFAARPPAELVAADKFLADWAASNLCAMLTRIQENSEDCDLEIAPEVSGYRWIAAGRLDFAVWPQLVEVKNTNKSFLASDFRQVLMYWL